MKLLKVPGVEKSSPCPYGITPKARKSSYKRFIKKQKARAERRSNPTARIPTASFAGGSGSAIVAIESKI